MPRGARDGIEQTMLAKSRTYAWKQMFTETCKIWIRSWSEKNTIVLFDDFQPMFFVLEAFKKGVLIFHGCLEKTVCPKP